MLLDKHLKHAEQKCPGKSFILDIRHVREAGIHLHLLPVTTGNHDC
jgi:hypothetical protein